MKKPRTFKFIKLDVFTRKALQGNQLAVFPDARGLSSAQMQAIAAEMKLSETTFVLPRAAAVERKRGTKVRIFTVAEELPFAGHPTLGTAYALRGKRDEIVLDLMAGRVPVRFSRRHGEVFGEMRQPEPTFGKIHDSAAVAAAIGLQPDELERELPIQTVSTGTPECIVPIRRLQTLRTIPFEWARAARYLSGSDAKFFYLVCRETESRAATLHARMIFYGGEDPATGSAAGCATAWAVRYGVLASGEQGMIEQGIEAGRPSEIYIRADKKGDSVSNVRAGGHVVEVMRGELRF